MTLSTLFIDVWLIFDCPLLNCRIVLYVQVSSREPNKAIRRGLLDSCLRDCQKTLLKHWLRPQCIERLRRGRDLWIALTKDKRQSLVPHFRLSYSVDLVRLHLAIRACLSRESCDTIHLGLQLSRYQGTPCWIPLLGEVDREIKTYTLPKLDLLDHCHLPLIRITSTSAITSQAEAQSLAIIDTVQYIRSPNEYKMLHYTLHLLPSLHSH